MCGCDRIKYWVELINFHQKKIKSRIVCGCGVFVHVLMWRRVFFISSFSLSLPISSNVKNRVNMKWSWSRQQKHQNWYLQLKWWPAAFESTFYFFFFCSLEFATRWIGFRERKKNYDFDDFFIWFIYCVAVHFFFFFLVFLLSSLSI